MDDTFEDEDYFTGPTLRVCMAERAQESLGVVLPRRYLDLLAVRNGGLLRRRVCPTPFRTSWAGDHFEVQQLYGIGGDNGIDAETGSAYLIDEWDYPPIGVVLFGTPSGGHDTVMLDYSVCGPGGEPSVAYVDEDRVPRTVAGSFGAFLDLLRPAQG
ncbi:SMI1/KNR4 family protein [Yinghuangia soli]|uniref:SMI1/KNR4 family protein n=1 Tax=Yinghuangia soli TaxID=2908204 RepID=A0AA41Q387_9ACTN|nr:SMI1/KNR4 family protein [Yinghuangia soli]MCF2530733.1 SMI1/KNR4 family protein [Yinghuangia soli]